MDTKSKRLICAFLKAIKKQLLWTLSILLIVFCFASILGVSAHVSFIKQLNHEPAHSLYYCIDGLFFTTTEVCNQSQFIKQDWINFSINYYFLPTFLATIVFGGIAQIPNRLLHQNKHEGDIFLILISLAYYMLPFVLTYIFYRKNDLTSKIKKTNKKLYLFAVPLFLVMMAAWIGYAQGNKKIIEQKQYPIVTKTYPDLASMDQDFQKIIQENPRECGKLPIGASHPGSFADWGGYVFVYPLQNFCLGGHTTLPGPLKTNAGCFNQVCVVDYEK